MSPQSNLFVREDNDDLNGASVSADTSPQLSELSRFLVFCRSWPVLIWFGSFLYEGFHLSDLSPR